MITMARSAGCSKAVLPYMRRPAPQPGFPPDAPQHTPGFLRPLPDFHESKEAKEALLAWLAEEKTERWDLFEKELLEILGIERKDVTIDLRAVMQIFPVATPEEVAVAASLALRGE